MNFKADTMTAITVEEVTKEFRLRAAGRTLKSAAIDILRGRSGRRRFAALRDVSFSVQRGETVGLIGANGAGKSTLLSILSGTMAPTRGRVSVTGTVSSLLELGAGFHPDLTGRENVYLYGAIMGLSRARMRERFDAVVAFSGLKEFIDQPVKHYSSGMYVRLGFAVAVEVDPDVLLIDEVLAVGDADFQRKCLNKMKEFRERRKTMLIISHDLHTIQSVSDRILLLDEGQVKGLGRPDQVVNQYRAASSAGKAKGMGREWGTGEVRLMDVCFLDRTGSERATFGWGERVTAVLRYHASGCIERPVFGFAVCDEQGRLVHGSNTQIAGVTIPEVTGSGEIRLQLDELNLASGTYLFSFSVHSEDHTKNYHRLEHRFPLTVTTETPFEGVCYLPSKWEL